MSASKLLILTYMEIDAFRQEHIFGIKQPSLQSFEIFSKMISPRCEAILQALEAVEKISIERAREGAVCRGAYL